MFRAWSSVGARAQAITRAAAAQVRAVLGALTGERARQLLLARTSARYLGRLVAGLQQKRGQEAKFRRRAAPRDRTLTLTLSYSTPHLCATWYHSRLVRLRGPPVRQARAACPGLPAARTQRRGRVALLLSSLAWVGGHSVAPLGVAEQTPSGVLASSCLAPVGPPQTQQLDGHVPTGEPGGRKSDT